MPYELAHQGVQKFSHRLRGRGPGIARKKKRICKMLRDREKRREMRADLDEEEQDRVRDIKDVKRKIRERMEGGVSAGGLNSDSGSDSGKFEDSKIDGNSGSI